MGILQHRPTLASPQRLTWLGCLGALCCACGLDVDNSDCRNDPYSDTIQIRFQPELAEPGNYRLDFASSPVNGTCNVVVGGTVIAPCSTTHLTVTGKNSDGNVVLMDLRAWFRYAPSTFDFTVTKDGVTVFDESFTPDYTDDEPNGDDCGIRRQAIVPVTVTL